MPIHALKVVFWRFDPLNGEQYQRNPQKANGNTNWHKTQANATNVIHQTVLTYSLQQILVRNFF